MIEINRFIDHTLLQASTTTTDIEKLCEEALKYQFYSVCINGSYVSLASQILRNSKVKVCSVVGFPLGAAATEAKISEARQAVLDGAEELDMVINIGWLRSKEFSKIHQEITRIRETAEPGVLKVIIETCYLTPKEITVASELAVKGGADYVKTSTGFGSSGAHLEHIEIIKKAVEGKAGIKASGGIKSLDVALSFIEAGANRIGTSSGVSIVKELD